MPIFRKARTAGGQYIPPPFVGPVNHTVAVPVDLSLLTNKEIDEHGMLKPGIPLNKDGTLVTSGDGYGVTVDYVKVLDDNAAGSISAAETFDVAVATICQVNQDVAEDILGRAYTNAEVASFVNGRVLL